MVVEIDKVVTLVYDIHVGDNIYEQVSAERPLTYCHGEKMIPSWVEEILLGKEEGQQFDEPLFFVEGHPLHGQDARFRGEILQIRDVMDWELEWIRNPERHCGGHCHGGCHGGDCNGNCNDCKKENKDNNGEHTCNCGKA